MHRLEEIKQADSPFTWARLRFHLIEAARIGSELNMKSEADDWREAANFATDRINAILENSNGA